MRGREMQVNILHMQSEFGFIMPENDLTILINTIRKLEVLTKSTVNNTYSVIRNNKWHRLKQLEYDYGCVGTVTRLAV